MSEPTAIIELKELGEYVRTEIEIYFTWFSFFLTILFASMGWALRTSVDRDGRVPHYPAMFLAIVVLFGIQTVLGIGASWVVYCDMKSAGARAFELLRLLASERSEVDYVAKALMPRAYHLDIFFAMVALFFNLILWPTVLGYVIRRYRQKKPVMAAVPPD